jgi:hypothetical protein
MRTVFLNPRIKQIIPKRLMWTSSFFLNFLEEVFPKIEKYAMMVRITQFEYIIYFQNYQYKLFIFLRVTDIRGREN